MAGKLKNTFQEPEVLDKGSPRGLISAWSGGYFTNTSNGGFTNVLGNSIIDANTYLNPLGWYVCDGAEVNDADSPIFNGAGRHVPNITDNRFLMGNIGIGTSGGSNSLTDHTHAHTIAATQAAHTHIQDAHTHIQDSHNHIQDAHGHGISDPGHRHQLESWYNISGNGANNPNNQGYGAAGPYGWSINSNYVGTGITVSSGTATNQASTATNQSTTAINQSAQPLITVTGTVGSGSAATSTENRPKYLSCLYIIKVK